MPIHPVTPVVVVHERREDENAASRESGRLVAELQEPEPVWRGDVEISSSGGDEEPPFIISRKWVTDFKARHAQARKVMRSMVYFAHW